MFSSNVLGLKPLPDKKTETVPILYSFDGIVNESERMSIGRIKGWVSSAAQGDVSICWYDLQSKLKPCHHNGGTNFPHTGSVLIHRGGKTSSSNSLAINCAAVKNTN